MYLKVVYNMSNEHESTCKLVGARDALELRKTAITLTIFNIFLLNLIFRCI